MTTPPPTRPPSRWPGLLLAGAAVGGILGYLELRLQSSVVATRDAVGENTEVLRDLEAAVQLLRVEQSADGAGIDALLAKIKTFAPHLQQLTAMTPEYQPRMGEILRAVESLGEESFPRILAAFRDTAPGGEDEERFWLMRAMMKADPERGADFLIRVVRGLDPNHRSLQISARNRANAARLLVEAEDADIRADIGAVLAEILSYETARGINPARVPPHLENHVPDAGKSPGGIENLLGWFLRTEHPDKETVMIRILKGREHNLITKQECVKELGAMRSRAAVDTIKDLYLHDVSAQGKPIFLNHCLDAIGASLRGEACDFFREQLREADHELVRAKLNDLIVQYC